MVTVAYQITGFGFKKQFNHTCILPQSILLYQGDCGLFVCGVICRPLYIYTDSLLINTDTQLLAFFGEYLGVN